MANEGLEARGAGGTGNRRVSRRSSPGSTLVELMVSVAVITIGVVGGMAAFKYVATAIQGSRGSTIATELAQEKIENLKDYSYYNLLLTTAPATDNNPTPPVVYDTSNYPPETIVVGNMPFIRYTYVSLAQVFQNNISTVSYTYPDTGMKQIEVFVVWQENRIWKEFSLTNLLENPNVNPLDSSVSGTVVQLDNWGGSGNPVLPGARVYAEQNPSYQAVSDANGNFSFRVYHGSYTIHVSSVGFFEYTSNTISATAGSNTPLGNLALQQIATGTVSGTVWLNPHPVISQVVADTYTYCGDGNQHDVEYIELFNPTTAAVNIGNAGTKNIYLSYYKQGNATVFSPDISDCSSGAGCWNWTYVSTYVAPGHYYLYSNCELFYINGSSITADAYETPAHTNHAMDASKAGSLIMTPGLPSNYWSLFPNFYWEIIGWNNPSGPPPAGANPPFASAGQYAQETTYQWPGCCWSGLPISSGVPTGTQIVRVSSPGAGVSDISYFGRAYNSQNNSNDFVYPTWNQVVGIRIGTATMFWSPYNTAGTQAGLGYASMSNVPQSSFTIVSGMVPYSGTAFGSSWWTPDKLYVSANDPDSGSDSSYYQCVSSGTLSTWPQGTYWYPSAKMPTWQGCYGIPYAQFSLTVATSPPTGWTIDMAYTYGAGYNPNIWPNLADTVYYTEITSVTATQNVVTNIPNQTTISSAPLPTTWLTSTTVNGFVKGIVQDMFGNNLGIPGEKVLAGGVPKTTGANGMFFATVSSGSTQVIANSNTAPPYVQSIQSNVQILSGQLTDMGLVQLAQGGQITGYVTSGTTPLPGVVMTALLSGNQQGAATSGSGGYFTIYNVPTGTYTVEPVLPPTQTSTPASATAVVGAGTAVFSTTFTVTGYLGALNGSVTLNGNSVTSGALILADDMHNGVIPNPPTTIYASSSPAWTYPYFAASSRSDGTYQLPLAGGASYYVSVYIPVINGSQVTVSTKVYNNIFVSPGSNQTFNLSYP